MINVPDIIYTGQVTVLFKNFKPYIAELQAVGTELRKSPERPVETMRKHPRLVEAYSSCTADVENDGHAFGEDLPEADKKALIAFLATL